MPLVHARADPIDDGANRAGLRVVVVRLRHVEATTTHAIEALAIHPQALPTCPRTVDRFVISARAPGAPRARLAPRILSP